MRPELEPERCRHDVAINALPITAQQQFYPHQSFAHQEYATLMVRHRRRDGDALVIGDTATGRTRRHGSDHGRNRAGSLTAWNTGMAWGARDTSSRARSLSEQHSCSRALARRPCIEVAPCPSQAEPRMTTSSKSLRMARHDVREVGGTPSVRAPPTRGEAMPTPTAGSTLTPGEASIACCRAGRSSQLASG